MTISSAKATAHFRFIRRAFVVYSFDDVFIPNTSFYGTTLSTSGILQAFQPTSEQTASAKSVLVAALTQEPFMCSLPGMYLE